jgi:hypothetical protein
VRCYQHECPSPTGDPCHYVDCDGRRCLSAWCEEHRLIVNDQVFCRRHAGIVSSIAEGKLVAPLLPGLDNRCPSLLVWMSDQIGDDLMASLSELGTVEVRPTCSRSGTDGLWEKVWIVRDGNDEVVRVSLEIQEPEPEITARVNGLEVASEVPPWVKHRGRLEWVAPAVDAVERKQFNAMLLDAFRSRLNTPSRAVAENLDDRGAEEDDEDAREDAAHHG